MDFQAASPQNVQLQCAHMQGSEIFFALTGGTRDTSPSEQTVTKGCVTFDENGTSKGEAS